MKFPPLIPPKAKIDYRNLSDEEKKETISSRIEEELDDREENEIETDFSLDLRYYYPKSDDYLSAIEALTYEHNFREINLSTTKLEMPAVDASFEMLISAGHVNFITVILDGIYLSDQRVLFPKLFSFLQKNDRIENLSLQQCSIYSQKLVDVLHKQKKLRSLRFSWNHLSDRESANIIKALPTSLEEIHSHRNSMASLSATVFSQKLKTMPFLRIIMLSGNCLGNANITLLAGSLSQSLHLSKLDLSSNAFTELGVKSLALAIAKHPSLLSLNCGWNAVGDLGAHYLSQALLQNHRLTELSLEHAHIQQKGYDSLKKVFDQKPELMRISLKRNPCAIKETDIFSIKKLLQQKQFFDAIEKKELIKCVSFIQKGVSPYWRGREKNSIFEQALGQTFYPFLDFLFSHGYHCASEAPLSVHKQNFPLTINSWKILQLPDDLMSIVWNYSLPHALAISHLSIN